VRWRFGPLEWLIATPAFHLWHHTLSGPRDRNFTSMLPCWDWLFGTSYLPRELPTDYRIDNPLPQTVLGQNGLSVLAATRGHRRARLESIANLAGADRGRPARLSQRRKSFRWLGGSLKAVIRTHR
jgi:hypothetical protein